MIAEKILAIFEENVLMVSILLLAAVTKDLKETDAKLVRSSNTDANKIIFHHLILRAEVGLEGWQTHV